MKQVGDMHRDRTEALLLNNLLTFKKYFCILFFKHQEKITF